MRPAASVKGEGRLVIEAEDGPGSHWCKMTDVHTGKQGWVRGDTSRIAYRK